MKKFLSLVLSVVLLLTLALNVTAASADGDPAIVCESVYCKAGDQVTVDVMIENNPGIGNLVITLTHAAELSLVGSANGGLLSDMTAGDSGTQFVFVNAETVTADGLLMTLTFQVSETAADGDYAFGFIVRECWSEQGEVEISAEDGCITVGELPSTAIDQFEYTTTGTEMTITKYVGEDPEVRIGSTYEIGGVTYTVTAIGEEAFFENTVVSSVEIPGTVKVIDAYAFDYCENLTAVKLNEGLQTIGACAFEGCALSQIVIPASVKTIGEYATYDCLDITCAVVLSKDAEIDQYAFGYYTNRRKETLLPDFVLKGRSGSTAETYAVNAGITFKEVLKLAGASVTLHNNLAVNIKAERVLFEDYGYTDPYVTVAFNGNTVKLTDYTVSGGDYVFTFPGIAPNQMMDTITMTLHVTDGDESCTTAAREYSIADYCYGMLNDSEYTADNIDQLRTLLVDMLHYGAASQTYTGYKTGELADANLTAEQLAWGTSAEPSLSSALDRAYATVANPVAQWVGAGLNLQDAVTIRMLLTAESVEGLHVKVESGEGEWIIPADQFQAANGVYYVFFDGLNAGQMRQHVFMTVYNGETPVSNTVRYSIGTYAYDKQDSEDAGLSKLVKAMMKYGDSANAYAN